MNDLQQASAAFARAYQQAGPTEGAQPSGDGQSAGAQEDVIDAEYETGVFTGSGSGNAAISTLSCCALTSLADLAGLAWALLACG
mgnify:CR=1 FL=1